MAENIDWSEVKELKKLATKYAWCDEEIRNFLEKDNGISIRKANFYSSSPTIEDINASFEYDHKGNSLPVFSGDKYLIQDQSKLLARLNKHFDGIDLNKFCSSTGFEWANGQFDRSDAIHYWAFINELRPQKIIEIGSGWSSRIAACASEKTNSSVTCIDPSPRSTTSRCQDA